jgi:hypothetical protein
MTRRRDIFVLWRGVSTLVIQVEMEMRVEMGMAMERKDLGDFLGRRIGKGI